MLYSTGVWDPQATTGSLPGPHWGPEVHSLGSWGPLTGVLGFTHWVPPWPPLGPPGYHLSLHGPHWVPQATTGSLPGPHWGPEVHSLGSWGPLTGVLGFTHWVPPWPPLGPPRAPLVPPWPPLGPPGDHWVPPWPPLGSLDVPYVSYGP